MTFVYRKGKTTPLVKKVVANSSALQVGEAVRIDDDGFIVTCPAGSTIYGVVQGIVGKNGETLRTNGAGGDFDPLGSYTFASDNETVDQVSVLIQTSKLAQYSAPMDATPGTTTGSNLSGYRMDHTSGGLVLDESTAATSAAQWVSLGLDPEDSTRVLVQIFEHQTD